MDPTTGERRPLESLGHFDPLVMKEGYLQKKGQMLKGWKPRWFVCDGRTLSYYSSRRDAKPSVVMELKYCTVEDGGRSETWNSTRIHLTDSATNTLYCLSSEDGPTATEWLTVLQHAIARVAGQRRQRLATQPSLSSAVTAAAAAAAAGTGTSATTTATTATAGAGSGAQRGEKRVTRVVSAPSTQSLPTATTATVPTTTDTTTATQRPKALGTGSSSSSSAQTTTAKTTVAMENDLARDTDLLRLLFAKHSSNSSGGSRHAVVFSPIGAAHGVLRSIGIDSRQQGRTWFARGSVVLPVPSEVAAYLVCDHAKRADWDVHFPSATHVAKFDDSTELVHLARGGEGVPQLQQTRPFVSPQVAALVGALVGGLVASSWAHAMSSMALVALLAAVANSTDYSSLCAPRDLLLLRHVKKRKPLPSTASTPALSANGDHGGDDDDDDDLDRSGHRQPIITILEKSVANERKPVASGVVRAHQGLGGWQLEPLDGGRTLVTYITDLDTRGWVSRETKRAFLLQRLECLAVLREYVHQSQLSVAQLGLDDADSGDESDDEVTHSRGSEVNVGSAVDAAGRSSLDFHPIEYYKGMVRLPSGGLKLTDKEIAKKQAGVLKEVLKSASSALLEGKGMVGLSLPVRIFEPRTNLERMIDLFLYGPTFLNVAADQAEPLERFKYVMAYAIAGLHHGVGQMKPFNPILGETYQASLNDGTDVCCEHTSHHPPITNFQLTGKKYSICGHVVWNPPTFSMKSSAFVQNNAGPIRIGFADGSVVSYHLPLMQSGGFLWGERTVEILGTIRFEDKKNHLACDLKFNPDEKKGMGGMFSSSATPSDFVRGVIVNTSTNAELSAVSGSWLDGLEFDGRPYWTFGREESGYAIPRPASELLESDSSNREDLRYLAASDLDLAQEWKVKLEVLQRADRKIRNEGRRPNHWSLKDGKGGH